MCSETYFHSVEKKILHNSVDYRAMELGRECMALWGYEYVDELVWVKTNQLQRIIRTGRTGHWLNHGKEHCLVYAIFRNSREAFRESGIEFEVFSSFIGRHERKPEKS